MAATINASNAGAGGLVQTSDASGILALQGGGNTGVSIDASGNATATTQSQANNSTRLATTAYADRVAVQQIVTSYSGALATGTTIMPFDDTIPQNTEGDQYFTATITPKSATSTLVIDVVVNVAHSGTAANTDIGVALFQDSTANALAVSSEAPFGIHVNINLKLRHVMTSGTTSATTFKVRVGAGVAGTTSINGSNSARLYGGKMMSGISIMEIGV